MTDERLHQRSRILLAVCLSPPIPALSRTQVTVSATRSSRDRTAMGASSLPVHACATMSANRRSDANKLFETDRRL